MFLDRDEAAAEAVLRGMERARPASAVTGRAWPGCRLVTDRVRALAGTSSGPDGSPPEHRSCRCCLVLLPVPGGLLLDLRRISVEDCRPR